MINSVLRMGQVLAVAVMVFALSMGLIERAKADTETADFRDWLTDQQIAYARGVLDTMERGHRETWARKRGEATAYLAGTQDAAEALSVLIEMRVPAGQRDKATRYLSRMGATDLARQLAALGEYDMASGIAGIMRRAGE